jgi:phosphatidylglycerol:prolipoprotein diacylglycerol transferase
MHSNYIVWDIDPEIVNLFGFYSLRYYGLFFVTGLLLSIYMLSWMFKREHLPKENLQKLTIYGIIGIFAGARLGHCIFYEPTYFLAHPLEMILPIKLLPEGGFKFTGYQGLASHGGALGLFIALIVYSRKTKHKLLDIIDLIAVVAGLAGGFIRLANLMNSEIIGMPTERPWAFIFSRVDDVPRHPAQLYEALAYFFIFILMFILYKTNREKLKNGFFIGSTLVMVFIARFLIEFIKENQVAFENRMSYNMGQLLSIPYIIAGVGLIVYGIIKTKKESKMIQNEMQ